MVVGQCIFLTHNIDRSHDQMTGVGALQDLTRFNKIAIHGTPQMAVD